MHLALFGRFALLALLGCSSIPVEGRAAATLVEAPPPVVEPAPPLAAPPVWPEEGAPLTRIPAPEYSGRALRVIIDAGHGAPGNLGNTSVLCEQEADFTRRAQDAVLARLTGLPGLSLQAGRPTAALRSYDERVRAFDAWKADAVISLHSDTREGDGWARSDATGCYQGLGAPGFAILYSDEGDSSRVEPRRALARAAGRRMAEAGFLAYDGADYPGLYAPDERVAGVFVDRHAPKKRIRMLRGVRVPLVIVETHQAVDPREVARWSEPQTLDAFSAAIYAAVIDATGGDPVPVP